MSTKNLWHFWIFNSGALKYCRPKLHLVNSLISSNLHENLDSELKYDKNKNSESNENWEISKTVRNVFIRKGLALPVRPVQKLGIEWLGVRFPVKSFIPLVSPPPRSRCESPDPPISPVNCWLKRKFQAEFRAEKLAEE